MYHNASTVLIVKRFVIVVVVVVVVVVDVVCVVVGVVVVGVGVDRRRCSVAIICVFRCGFVLNVCLFDSILHSEKKLFYRLVKTYFVTSLQVQVARRRNQDR